MFIRGKMGIYEITYIYIVSNSSSIMGWIIISIDRYLFPFPDRNIEHIRKEIIRNTIREFSDMTRWMCSDRIEVAKWDDRPSTESSKVFEELFDNKLRRSIWIGRSKWHIFGEWRNIICSIDGCRRGKYYFTNTVFLHNLEKCYTPSYIVIMVVKWESTTLPYCLESSKVYNSIEGIS